MTPFRKLPSIATVLCACCIVAGCAHPDFLAPGMSRADLDARFGKPDVERREDDSASPGGGAVLIYSSAPLGQRASAVHLGPDGRVVRVEPLLNTEHFATIRIGTWNRDEVFAHFGRPADISSLPHYPSVWSYRYRENEVWDSMFHVMFDDAGVVRQTQNGPDPMYEKNRENGRM